MTNRREMGTASLVQLQAHGFDLMAQVEAFLRHVREIQMNVSALKETSSETKRVEALHQIRTHAASLLTECAPFCEMVGQVQQLAEAVSPEQRQRSQLVAHDRRRRR